METNATVEKEHTPEVKWPERIIIIRNHDGLFTAKFDVDYYARRAEEVEFRPYQILRVTPPVERRVVIDWEAVNRECDEAHASGVYAGPPSAMAQKIIERHATIEETTR